MRNSITLHPDKGVNPRITTCHSCGVDVGVALIGVHERVYRCKSCNATLLGTRVCKCGSLGAYTRNLEEHEKLPIETCDKCAARMQEAADEVAKGGVFWRCTKCNSDGAVRAESDLAKNVRKQMNIHAPDPCGLEVESCPVCEESK
jgi:hypothetical protein